MWCRGGMLCDNFTHTGQLDMAFNSKLLVDSIEEEMLLSSTDDDLRDAFLAAEAACKGMFKSVRLYDAPESPMPFLPFADDPIMLAREEEDLRNLASNLINPRTLEKVAVADIFKNEVKNEVASEEPKPYHAWTHDHDYFGKRIKTESAGENSTMDTTEVTKSENEPIVEVWKIDSFPKDPQTADPDQADNVWSKGEVKAKGSRRSSTRTAELKEKRIANARKIATALKYVENEQAKRRRQYKNVRPKNSVETTPSQSDIEEWSSVPAKQTNTKVTKKKTTKGRIDHSESERQRREVLRENFAALSDLIPDKYLRGEKPSSQISKQKILNGAKAFIQVLRSCKGTYKYNLLQNQHLRSRWQDRKLLRQQIEASRKCMKKK